MSSLYSHFLRAVVLPIGDWYRGIPIGAALKELRETQWWSHERVGELQSRKLQSLITRAYEHVPYYREVMDERGLRPADIRSADDLQKLPVLTKELVRANYPARITNRTVPQRKTFAHRTGGSTGEPMFFTLSRSARAYDRASYYRCLEWCGNRRGDPILSVWGQLVVSDRHSRLVRELKLRLITRQGGLDAFRMTPETMSKFVKTMHRRRVKVLRGYTSALVQLAEFIRQEGLQLPPLRALTTTAEQIMPEDRRTLENTFNAPLFDQYGCGEVGGIAYECERHTGLHIAAEHCVVEVVDDEGRRLPPGETGRLALTSLDNEATPFIRYLNGDEGALLPDTCPCGRGLPLMSPVSGRTADMIYGLNGNRVHGEFFTHLIHELGWTESLPVREFQVVQTHADHIRFRVISDREPTAQQRSALIARIQDYLGPMQVEYEQTDAIERSSSGKRRFTLREWQPTQQETRA